MPDDALLPGAQVERVLLCTEPWVLEPHLVHPGREGDRRRPRGVEARCVVDTDLGPGIGDEANPRGLRVDAGEPQGYMLSYAGQFRDFAAATLRGAALAAGPEESLGELRTALAMERSAASRLRSEREGVELSDKLYQEIFSDRQG